MKTFSPLHINVKGIRLEYFFYEAVARAGISALLEPAVVLITLVLDGAFAPA